MTGSNRMESRLRRTLGALSAVESHYAQLTIIQLCSSYAKGTLPPLQDSMLLSRLTYLD